MELMARYPDKYFELAIVDPPYAWDKKKTSSIDIRKQHRKINWNKISPTQNYFNELFRISKNQIVWGGNYFSMPPTRGFIFWWKHQPILNYADGEYAWTSFDCNAKIFDYGYTNVINYENRIHPTQKPVALYKWLLRNYAKPGDKILDTHLGSGSIAIACHDLGFDLTACELDKEYFDKSMERIEKHTAQQFLGFGNG